MTFEELKDKALSLPYEPGVYIMRDLSDTVIYVGKAKKLKNRVSQYFQDTASHTPKTRAMVSRIDHFDVIVARSEFEALILECSLIKRYMPHYNILLKDDKGYPYVRLNIKDPYPNLTIASRIAEDGALYFGPFGTRGTTGDVIEALQVTFRLPNCGRQFPRDIGKERPCLNYHMNRCAGWCRECMTGAEYREVIEQVRRLLQGNYKSVAEEIRGQMLKAADELQFELAAQLRDRLNAVEALGQKQLVTAGSLSDTDVIGYGSSEAKACLAVLHFNKGNLLDKEYQVLPIPDNRDEEVLSLLAQYYMDRNRAPKLVLLPFELEDLETLSGSIRQAYGHETGFKVPQRGENMRLVELACKNAFEEAKRLTDKEERVSGSLQMLGKMLGIPLPRRIESYDISNISGTDIVAGMVVFKDGKSFRSGYRRFKIRGLADQDDYASMHQVISRRFGNYLVGDSGFEEKPDLLLIDGGEAHAKTAVDALRELGLSIPPVGMVKDARHRTRALITPEGAEIAIDGNQAVFSLVGNIQEETHRTAISYHRELRSRRLHYSELDAIPGIGPKRKQELLKAFKSLQAMRQASLEEFERILPQNTALEVYKHFHSEQ